jgi:hypothetical protein
VKSLFCILVFLFYSCFLTISFSADKDSNIQKTLDRLEKIWKIQQKEIATAHIVYQQVHWQKLGNPSWVKLTPQEISEIVSKQDFSKTDMVFDELATKFHIDKSFTTKKEIFYAPPKSKIQSTVPPINQSKISSGIKDYISVFDGKNTISVDPLNNQTDIVLGGSFFPMTTLRYDPSFLTPEIRNKFSYELKGELLEALIDTEMDTIHRVIDIKTGLLVDNNSHFKNGTLGRDTFQRCFFVSPGEDFISSTFL